MLSQTKLILPDHDPSEANHNEWPYNGTARTAEAGGSAFLIEVDVPGSDGLSLGATAGHIPAREGDKLHFPGYGAGKVIASLPHPGYAGAGKGDFGDDVRLLWIDWLMPNDAPPPLATKPAGKPRLLVAGFPAYAQRRGEPARVMATTAKGRDIGEELEAPQPDSRLQVSHGNSGSAAWRVTEDVPRGLELAGSLSSMKTDDRWWAVDFTEPEVQRWIAEVRANPPAVADPSFVLADTVKWTTPRHWHLVTHREGYKGWYSEAEGGRRLVIESTGGEGWGASWETRVPQETGPGVYALGVRAVCGHRAWRARVWREDFSEVWSVVGAPGDSVELYFPGGGRRMIGLDVWTGGGGPENSRVTQFELKLLR
ncbi:MAG: hypothetical protein RLY93_20495 [Sumerlaeia bacterium]